MSKFVDADEFAHGINAWFKQVEGTTTDLYRDLIKDILKRILRATPQWSGCAVANWNVSIGAPNMSWDPSLGDEIDSSIAHVTDLQLGARRPRERGDEKWINRALARNEPIIDSVRYRDRVFISNGVEGDDAIWGGSYSSRKWKGTATGQPGGEGFHYLEAMQVKGSPWYESLREVNSPYQVVQESMIIVSTRYARKGLTLPRVGGHSWSNP